MSFFFICHGREQLREHAQGIDRYDGSNLVMCTQRGAETAETRRQQPLATTIRLKTTTAKSVTSFCLFVFTTKSTRYPLFVRFFLFNLRETTNYLLCFSSSLPLFPVVLRLPTPRPLIVEGRFSHRKAVKKEFISSGEKKEKNIKVGRGIFIAMVSAFLRRACWDETNSWAVVGGLKAWRCFYF